MWIGGTLASVLAGWRMLRRDQSNSNVTEASNEANIEAINTYKQLVSELRADKANSDARADKFAEERNEAWKQYYAAQGKIEAMADQVMNLQQEIALLRAEVAQLRNPQPKG